MPMYRKKPVVIEARKWDGTNACGADLVSWGHRVMMPSGNVDGNIELRVETLNGPVLVKVGDYVCRTIKGDFYPCNPEVFEANHEPV